MRCLFLLVPLAFASCSDGYRAPWLASAGPSADAGADGESAGSGGAPSAAGEGGQTSSGEGGTSGEGGSAPSAPECTPEPRAVTFRRQTLLEPEIVPNVALVTSEVLARSASSGFELLVNEPTRGRVVSVTDCTATGDCKASPLDQDLNQPLRTRPVDFDRDGDEDLLIADIGEVMAVTDPVGRALILETTDAGLETHVLIDALGRVTCAEAGDFDGDDDLDVVVCEFGAAEGSLLWLEQTEPWIFEPHAVRVEAGALSARPVDEDQDGDLDLIVAISQSAQQVLFYENDGEGRFDERLIFEAETLDFGLGAIEFTDLDRDLDDDILLVHGDYLDESYDLGNQGLSWFERLGPGAYQRHDVLPAIGAYAVRAVDLDADCDQDLVLVSYQEPNVLPELEPEDWGPALQWLENDGAQRFTPHTVDDAPARVVTLEVTEVNGIPWVLVGSMAFGVPTTADARLEAFIVGP